MYENQKFVDKSPGWNGSRSGPACGACRGSGQGRCSPPANPAPILNTGDTAWMLVSSALVLLMTPGLAFFYGGMVRSKNVLSTMMHSFVVMGIVGIQFVVIGYSLSFGPGNDFIGGLGKVMLNGITPDTLFQYVATSANAIPEYVFRDVPDDVRHNYHRPGFRCDCRAYQVFRMVSFCHSLDYPGIRPDCPLGMGWRLAYADG